jgi:hypothetical protein
MTQMFSKWFLGTYNKANAIVTTNYIAVTFPKHTHDVHLGTRFLKKYSQTTEYILK